MARKKKQWSELSRGRKVGVIVLGAAQIALTCYAARDLAKRPAAEVKGGHKLPWALALGVNWIGPIAYLTAGRETTES